MPDPKPNSSELYEAGHGMVEAQRRIEKGRREESKNLDLSGLDLTTLPEDRWSWSLRLQELPKGS